MTVEIKFLKFVSGRMEFCLDNKTISKNISLKKGDTWIRRRAHEFFETIYVT